MECRLWELHRRQAGVLARLVYFFTRFFMAGVWVLPAPRFFFARRLGLGAPSTSFFLSPANGRIKRKQALFFIAFSGFSLHGEFKHNSTYFPPKILRKTSKNPPKSPKI
jgi:hypothetical protein